jgi:hypothetical protein
MKRLKAELKKICGEGVSGFEDCPPIYHIEFDREEFHRLLDDPVGVMKELGWEGPPLRITISDKVWLVNERKFVDAGSPEDPPTEWKTLCCGANGDGGTTCCTWKEK